MSTSPTSLQLETATGVALSLPLAGLGSRAFAYLIDWHIRILVVLLWILGWLVWRWPDGFNGLSEDRSAVLWLVTAPSLFYMLYHPVLELVMQGNSPGKRWAKIKCVNNLGQPPSSGAILIRNVMRFIDGLPAMYTVGVVAMLLSKEQLRLGDMVAGTRMIMVGEDAKQAMADIQEIKAAGLPVADAELVVDVLDRWDTLTKEKRAEYARKLVSRAGHTPKKTEALLRKQLEGLLKPGEAGA